MRSTLTDSDKKIGPITYGRAGWNPLRLVWSSGGHEDYDGGRTNNNITVYAFGWCARIPMPNLIQPYRIRHEAKLWDAETIDRLRS